MGHQHVELDIHWQCSKLDIIEETWASGKGSQSATEKNGQDPEYAVCDAHSLVSQDSQVRIKDTTAMPWKKNHDKTVHQCNVLEVLQQLDPSWSRCVQVEIHSKNIQSSDVHVHPPQMIQLSAGVPQNNNSYGLEEEHDSMWAVLSVMDIPIASAFTRNLQVATTVIAQVNNLSMWNFGPQLLTKSSHIHHYYTCKADVSYYSYFQQFWTHNVWHFPFASFVVHAIPEKLKQVLILVANFSLAWREVFLEITDSEWLVWWSEGLWTFGWWCSKDAAAGDGISSSDVQVTCAYRPAAWTAEDFKAAD